MWLNQLFLYLLIVLLFSVFLMKFTEINKLVQYMDGGSKIQITGQTNLINFTSNLEDLNSQ